MNSNNQEYNYIKGENCQFNFYVIAFDTKNGYQTYGEIKADLSLSQAQAEYKNAVAQNPMHVNTMLGVSFITERTDLEPQGMGAVDLLQHIDGQTRLSEDYLNHPILCNESMLTVNAINILKNNISVAKPEADKSDNRHTATEKNSLLGKLRFNEAAVKQQNELGMSIER